MHWLPMTPRSYTDSAVEKRLRSTQKNHSSYLGVVPTIFSDVTSKNNPTAATERIRKAIWYINVFFTNSSVIKAATGPIDDTHDIKILQKKKPWAPDMANVTTTLYLNVVGTFSTTVTLLACLMKAIGEPLGLRNLRLS